MPIALAVLLVLGIGLRAALWFAYQPTPLIFNDSLVYVGMADGGLFSDPSRAIGYSLLLAALHALSPTVGFAVFVQHLLGIATALLIFGAFRRLGPPLWVAVVAAGGVLLSLDQTFLEHSLLSEAPFTFAVAAVLYASVRALDAPLALAGGITSGHLWIVVAGVALGLSAWIRPLGLPLVVLLAIWFAYAIPGTARARLGRAGLAALASAIILVAYAGIQSAENGYFGFTRATGWTFYSRIAQFADCDRFEPPPGTEKLCESTPPSARSGPDFYAYDPRSPARELFGEPPTGDDRLGAFARAALLAQPLDYLKVVGIDSLRYFRPSLESRPYSGGGYAVIDIDRGAPRELVFQLESRLDRYYSDADLDVHGSIGELADLQDLLRLQPWAMALVAVLGVIGLVLSRGRLRAGLALALSMSAALLVIPPATAIWSARYAVPVTGPLVGSAAVGAWLLASRLRDRGSPLTDRTAVREAPPAAAPD